MVARLATKSRPLQAHNQRGSRGLEVPPILASFTCTKFKLWVHLCVIMPDLEPPLEKSGYGPALLSECDISGRLLCDL